MEWIEVSKKQPPYLEKVLLHSYEFESCFGSMIHVGYRSKEGFIVPGYGYCPEPTHWTPLPRPPGE
jgi:Protein of unknown function (DUF551)